MKKRNRKLEEKKPEGRAWVSIDICGMIPGSVVGLHCARVFMSVSASLPLLFPNPARFLVLAAFHAKVSTWPHLWLILRYKYVPIGSHH
jgi:hypothetical protein